MTHVLHVDSGGTSLSRQLGHELLAGWRRREPDLVVTHRDLDAEPLPFVNDSWVAAALTPPDLREPRAWSALRISEALIAEVEAADVLIIGAPMSNLGIPARLKTWIDQIVRVGRTYADAPSLVGMLEGKRAIVIATESPELPAAGLDFRSSYLQAILGFIGITDVDVVTAGDTLVGLRGAA